VEFRARFLVNCSILFPGMPLLRRPQAARDAGFDAIEFWWPFDSPVPSDAEVDAFVGAVGDAGVQLAALNFAGGDMAAGERGLMSDPLQRSAFRDNVDVAVGIADRLGTRMFNALYGNRLTGHDPHAQDDLAADNLAHAAHVAAGIDAVLLLEPLSGIPDYPVRTAADAVAVINRVGIGNIRLLADLYHLRVNGEDLEAVIDGHIGDIGHVQIADAPGRGAPGTGWIDIAGRLRQLHELGYRGYVSLEYAPGGGDPFGWLPREYRSTHEV
jgi:hydroxypyruvate isomerase